MNMALSNQSCLKELNDLLDALLQVNSSTVSIIESITQLCRINQHLYKDLCNIIIRKANFVPI